MVYNRALVANLLFNVTLLQQFIGVLPGRTGKKQKQQQTTDKVAQD